MSRLSERTIEIAIDTIPKKQFCDFCDNTAWLNEKREVYSHVYGTYETPKTLSASLPTYHCEHCDVDFYLSPALTLAFQIMYRILEEEGEIDSANHFIRLLISRLL